LESNEHLHRVPLVQVLLDHLALIAQLGNMAIMVHASPVLQDSTLPAADRMFAFPALQEQWRLLMVRQAALHVVKDLSVLARL